MTIGSNEPSDEPRFHLSEWTREDEDRARRKRNAGRPQSDVDRARSAERKSRLMQRPDRHDAKAYKRWQRTPIPPGVSNREVTEWLWEDGELVCPYCLEPVDIQLRGEHPRAAQLDHIDPKAHGGKHEWGNVQVAHGLCNRVRGADGTYLLPEHYRAALSRSEERYELPMWARKLLDRKRVIERLEWDYQFELEGRERFLADSESVATSDLSREELEARLARTKRILAGMREEMAKLDGDISVARSAMPTDHET